MQSAYHNVTVGFINVLAKFSTFGHRVMDQSPRTNNLSGLIFSHGNAVSQQAQSVFHYAYAH